MRPVYRSKSHQPMIDILIGRKSKDPDTKTAAFPTIKALQCYAAMLGFEKGVKHPREREVEGIEWHVFDFDGHGQYVYLIALAEIGDVAILKGDADASESSEQGYSDDDMIKIFEEYAEGGFLIMREWLENKNTDTYGTKAIMQGLKKGGFLKGPTTDEPFEDPGF